MPDHIYVDPDALLVAAAELEALASRLEASVQAADPALDVPPPGAEEVSRLISQHFGGLTASFRPAAARGVEELRTAALTIRNQAAHYTDLETRRVAALHATV
ncbi:PE family protein [Rhodococcus zopfii]|uniref:PE family protein n=1 Tax=Rhodococcus zopfii TaxID=43772 RepID=A0ABU3WUL6_9NOCA|nr:PE family protein [Rhodococcus zopfii]MDV2477701.1 PE family protein [Rhodococcus zopfii]